MRCGAWRRPRYYDPAAGRFLQRDPIGIQGGLNVYAYVGNDPLTYIDPSGLGKRWDKFKKKVKSAGKKVKKGAKKVWDVVKKLPGYVLPSSPVPADAAPGAACAYMYDARRRHAVKEHDDGLPDKKCPTCKRLTLKSHQGKGR